MIARGHVIVKLTPAASLAIVGFFRTEVSMSLMDYLRSCSAAFVLLLASFPLQAQVNKAWPRYDPQLIEKLYRGDFPHISDDNFGRMDLEAVMLAFRNDSKVGKDKCALFGEDEESAPDTAKRLAYIHYLNSNSTTGEFPSAQFMALSVLGSTTQLA